jgi:bifunctional N-acetylglucosamine-1-phosphate-uridyltransferase/glucosamine-1-phosphate-acetyltransferase GlmU-like protein
MKRIIIIPAAGKGSRLESNLPKLFTPIFNNNSVYDILITDDTSYVDEFILLLSPEGLNYFNTYLKSKAPANLYTWVQDEPTGMFDAINQIFTILIERDTDDFDLIIQWGDQPFCDKFIHELLFLDLKNYQTSVPLVWVHNPYVQFKLGKNLKVIETRENEMNDIFGFKDMGIFAFKRNIIESCWNNYKIYAKKGKVTNEKNFVKFFEVIDNNFPIFWRIDQPYYKSIGINTKNDLIEANMFLNQYYLTK